VLHDCSVQRQVEHAFSFTSHNLRVCEHSEDKAHMPVHIIPVVIEQRSFAFVEAVYEFLDNHMLVGIEGVEQITQQRRKFLSTAKVFISASDTIAATA